MKLHLEEKGFQAFVERKVQTSQGGEHIPDIFVIGDERTFIEEKGSLPGTKENFAKEISNVLEYSQEHVFEGARFTPQLVLLCPEDVIQAKSSALASYRRRLCVVSYPFPVEDPIVFKRHQGKIIDEKLIPLLAGKEKVAQSRSLVPKIKFLRGDPPVPYSAWHIWLATWSYSSTQMEDFKVNYSAVLEHCKLFYPPWLSQESSQITQGRLNDALELLAYVGWVEFKPPLSLKTIITVRFSKGDRIRKETFEFLTRKYIEFLSVKSKKLKRHRGRLPSARALKIKPSASNEQLDRYISK